MLSSAIIEGRNCDIRYLENNEVITQNCRQFMYYGGIESWKDYCNSQFYDIAVEESKIADSLVTQVPGDYVHEHGGRVYIEVMK